MQFREVRDSVQIIRATYVKPSPDQRGKMVAKLLATFPAWGGELAPALERGDDGLRALLQPPAEGRGRPSKDRPKATPEDQSRLWAELGDDGQDALREYVRGRVRDYLSRSTKWAVEGVAKKISEAAQAMPATTIGATQAQEIWIAMEQLQQALRKAGHRRPRKSTAEADSPDGQAEVSTAE